MSNYVTIDNKKYRMTFDFHTHTTYSHGFFRPHGKGSVEENVQAAIEQGLDAIAISDHGPGHLFYGIRRDQIRAQRREIEESQKRHPQIRIFQSVEANIVDNGENDLDVSSEEFPQFDFVHAGYHYGTRRGHMLGNFLEGHGISLPGMEEMLLKANTEMTLQAVRSNHLKILTHPGDKGSFDIERIARACAETGTWMEISTWHSHLTVEEIRIAMKEEVDFVISSDAHTPDRVGSFQRGLERAFEAGLPASRIVNIEEIE